MRLAYPHPAVCDSDGSDGSGSLWLGLTKPSETCLPKWNSSYVEAHFIFVLLSGFPLKIKPLDLKERGFNALSGCRRPAIPGLDARL